MEITDWEREYPEWGLECIKTWTQRLHEEKGLDCLA